MKEKVLLGIIALGALLLIVGVFSKFSNVAPEKMVTSDNKIATVAKKDVMKIKAGTTYSEIIKDLGKTVDKKGKDSEYHIVQYQVGDEYIFLVFKKFDEKSILSGEEMLSRARPVDSSKTEVAGTVMNVLTESESVILTVEPSDKKLKYDTIEVTASDITRVSGSADNLTYKSIKAGDKVRIQLIGSITSSSHAIGTARSISITN